MLQKCEFIQNKSFNFSISLKLEINHLLSKSFYRKYIKDILEVQNEYIEKYNGDKNRKYKKLADRLPFRDLSRNKYLLECPKYN